MNSSPASAFKLSLPEKLQLVEDLWDDIASDPSNVPLHEWQKEELNRRKQNLMRDPGSALSWEEVKSNISDRHGQ